MSGFTYNGIHSSTYHVEYVPDASARWFNGADFSVYETDVAWHNGGYYYGNSAKTREFVLHCWFDGITIKQREQIRKWLGRNTSGNLILDDLPFVYWKVRPTKMITGVLYNDNECGTMNLVYSGTFDVTLTAYEPFGYLTRKSNDGSENDGAENYCGIIRTSNMPQLPTTSSTSFSVYNPGTESCGLTIRISGTSTAPFRFYNIRNNTTCEFNSVPTGSLILDINGDTGLVETYTTITGEHENGFAYHNHGVLRLDPCESFTNVNYTAEPNGTAYNLTISGVAVSEDFIGGVIIFSQQSSETARIIDINKETNTLICNITHEGFVPNESGKVVIRQYNYIYIQSKNNSGSWVLRTNARLTMSSIEIDYNPRLL